jgi:hypothetical protein
MCESKHETVINIYTTYAVGRWNRNEISLYHACSNAAGDVTQAFQYDTRKRDFRKHILDHVVVFLTCTF